VDCQADLMQVVLAFGAPGCTAGSSSAIRMAIMAITTSSSISVNPRRSEFVLNMAADLLQWGAPPAPGASRWMKARPSYVERRIDERRRTNRTTSRNQVTGAPYEVNLQQGNLALISSSRKLHLPWIRAETNANRAGSRTTGVNHPVGSDLHKSCLSRRDPEQVLVNSFGDACAAAGSGTAIGKSG
jgi:hypothetical protein